MEPIRIKAIRDRLKMSQEQFAHEVGVTMQTVNRWEGGKCKPYKLAVEKLKKIEAEYESQ